MACCCKVGRPKATSCLGRCDLPKHRCLDKEEIKPGPVPSYMGWLWDARDSPEHQLRCGWRPGHISCPVLRRIEQHNCSIRGDCQSCAPCPLCEFPKVPCTSPRAPCSSCCAPSKSCIKIDGCSPIPCIPSPMPCAKPSYFPCQSIIRIVRHGGNYSISTEPSSVSNAPSGPYPLKYVLNIDDDDTSAKDAKYSVEAKFNDYRFNYTTSQTSFVLDFSPPEPNCQKPCPKRITPCPSGSDTTAK